MHNAYCTHIICLCKWYAFCCTTSNQSVLALISTSTHTQTCIRIWLANTYLHVECLNKTAHVCIFLARHPCVQKTHIRQRKMIDTQPMCAKDTEQTEENDWHTTPVCTSKPWACKMLSLVPSHLKHLDGTSHHKQTWSGEPKDISPWKRWACSHHLWSASKTGQEFCTLPYMSLPPLYCPAWDWDTWLFSPRWCK